MIFRKWMVLASLTAMSATAMAAQPAQLEFDTLARDLTISLNSDARDLINWKVGDKAAFEVVFGGFGMKGTMAKYVAKDEGTALWVNSDMSISGQNQKSEMLMNKADGKVLKILVNGKEQQVPEQGDMQITSQEMGEVTVKAGKFQCAHILAKSSDYPKIEVWINPRDTVMEGTLKQVLTHPQYGDISLELTSFSKAP